VKREAADRPAVRLMAAVLCLELDCNTVFDGSAGAPCPRCGSVMSHPLAAWLDRGARTRVRAGSARADRTRVVSTAA
jgi:hypothetical protein